MDKTQLKKQYNDVLSSLKKIETNDVSVLQIIDAIKKNYEELVCITDNEFSYVEYDFYVDMLKKYCEELDCMGIKYKADTQEKNNECKTKETCDKKENTKDKAKEEPKKKKHPVLTIIAVLFIILVIINIYLESLPLETNYHNDEPHPSYTRDGTIEPYTPGIPNKPTE